MWLKLFAVIVYPGETPGPGRVATVCSLALLTAISSSLAMTGRYGGLFFLQARKNDKRATLNQLLDDLQKASRNANSSKRGSDSCSREELEWTVEQMLLHGLLAIEFGFTAYTTNSYLVTTAAGEALHTAQGNKRYACQCTVSYDWKVQQLLLQVRSVRCY